MSAFKLKGYTQFELPVEVFRKPAAPKPEYGLQEEYSGGRSSQGSIGMSWKPSRNKNTLLRNTFPKT